MATLNASVAEPSRQVLASIERRRMEDRRSWDAAMRKGFAGGVAGCAAKTVVAPLDRIKILFQTSHSQFIHHATSWRGLLGAAQDIRQLQGIRALFQGHSATLLRVFPFSGTNFLAYEQFRSALISSGSSETPYRRFVAGSLAGAVSTFLTYPLELIRVRMACEMKNSGSSSSWSRVCRTMYRGTAGQSGIAGFYQGLAPTLLGILPYSGFSFLAHDQIGDWLRSPMLAPFTTIASTRTRENDTTRISGSHSSIRLTITAQLFSGAMAGLVAQTISYPLETIRRRMQVCTPLGTNRRVAIAETAITIFKERGLGGFFFGLPIGYLKVAPMMATSFFVYDRMRWYLGLYNTRN
uniref:Mitochondrial thiamine pyrophosphate carrier 1 n=1 Tax=Bionectria ochroleuca TaxID=29856 RepID=A0A8H7KA86_BIOOC